MKYYQEEASGRITVEYDEFGFFVLLVRSIKIGDEPRLTALTSSATIPIEFVIEHRIVIKHCPWCGDKLTQKRGFKRWLSFFFPFHD
jgi:hypothetical protein